MCQENFKNFRIEWLKRYLCCANSQKFYRS